MRIRTGKNWRNGEFFYLLPSLQIVWYRNWYANKLVNVALHFAFLKLNAYIEFEL